MPEVERAAAASEESPQRHRGRLPDPELAEGVDLQVCVQHSLDVAIVVASGADGLRRPEWVRRVLARAARADPGTPAPRSKVRLRDEVGRLADDAALLRALARMPEPQRPRPTQRSRVLRVRMPAELDEAIKRAARLAHQPHGDWIRDALTRAATRRIWRLR
ncbi:MAG: hypothetical protein ACREQM_21455 [Candidatus Dormibacteraceae bacterium]